MREFPMARVAAMLVCAMVAGTLAHADAYSGKRAACTFKKGARVEETLGYSSAARKAIPIKHVVVVMQENRSYDHYFSKLNQKTTIVQGNKTFKIGQASAVSPTEMFFNKDKAGNIVRPYHLPETCLKEGPGHQWDDMHTTFNNGRLDSFVTNAASDTSDGHYVMGYYDSTDIPFYYWLANTYALSDHHFASVASGTWSNRNFMYTATSGNVKNTGERTLKGVPTIFDSLFWHVVPWGVYTDGTPRQDCLGWTSTHFGVAKTSRFFELLSAGILPFVSFVDPSGSQDEHPPNDIQGGEAFARKIYKAAIASPLWDHMAIIFTYDEGGNLADHVAPQKACAPNDEEKDVRLLGYRVPLIVVSPYAKRHHISRTVHDHTAILRFIELLHNLPALSDRDANADALLDLFDFSKPQKNPEEPPEAGTGGCK